MAIAPLLPVIGGLLGVLTPVAHRLITRRSQPPQPVLQPGDQVDKTTPTPTPTPQPQKTPISIEDPFVRRKPIETVGEISKGNLYGAAASGGDRGIQIEPLGLRGGAGGASRRTSLLGR